MIELTEDTGEEIPYHPAKFSDALLPVMDGMLGEPDHLLEPFAGQGKILRVRAKRYTLIELQRKWALGALRQPEYDRSRVRVFVGNSLELDRVVERASVPAVGTSPVYPNRMRDHHNARDIDPKTGKPTPRMTYTHQHGSPLEPGNMGAMTDAQYWPMAEGVFAMCLWALQPGKVLCLNISDHYENREIVPVTDRYLTMLHAIGYRLVGGAVAVRTPRCRRGANWKLRCEAESVILLWKPTARDVPPPPELVERVRRTALLRGAVDLEDTAIRYLQDDARPRFREHLALRVRAREALDAAWRAGFRPEDFDEFADLRDDLGAWRKLRVPRKYQAVPSARGDGSSVMASVAAALGEPALRLVDPHDAARQLRRLLDPWLAPGKEMHEFFGPPDAETEAMLREAAETRAVAAEKGVP